MSTEQLIISVGTILLVARVFGWIFRWLGQPQVVGEMIAGIMLGPSFFGRYWPSAFAHILPPSSFDVLSALSQLGLLLFMFVVGLEVNIENLLKQRTAVVLTSLSSILVPFVVGIVLATKLYPEFGGKQATLLAFALFVGTAMSVTAFPVLARVLKERSLFGTNLGALAISCAAIDDVVAWLLLAILTAIVHSSHNWTQLLVTLFGLALFVVIMLVPVRRAANYVQARRDSQHVGRGSFSILLLIMLAASWTTTWLGVHALFGAFVAGAAMPKEKKFVAQATERIESLTLVLLLPLFFALTGLRTRIDLFTGAQMWGYTILIIGVATVGKLAGATLMSRAASLGWGDSVRLGILVNTRGLVELVVLNVGLELGILSSGLFTMLVIMALVTTFMTTPLLKLTQVTGWKSKQLQEVQWPGLPDAPEARSFGKD
ncbi:MAG TPA: cation:proton antiporter [Terriglobales bacterium]|nr:cation:proton antiporter [Terriglobales bacterium]